MNAFLFMLKKAIRPTVAVTVGLTCFAVLFMIASFKSAYGDDKLYAACFDSLDEGEEGYNAARYNSEKLSAEDKEILDKADRYISTHSNGSVPPILPNEMVDEIFETLFGDSETAGSSQYQAVYGLISKQLYSQTFSRELIKERTEGYSRNIRRGVTDEYSLKIAELMMDDYEKVLEKEENHRERYDTRYANNFIGFISSEPISYIGIFLLLFSSFSAELQSGRYKAFKLTKTGAVGYSSYRIIIGILQAAVFFSVYFFALYTAVILSSGTKISSMPMQYLSGFELSHLPINFGGFVLRIYFMKLSFTLMLSAAVMLLSMVSRRIIPSAIVCLIPLAAPAALSRIDISLNENLRQMMTCDIIGMNNDIGAINIGGSPIDVAAVFFIAVIMIAVCSAAAALILSGRRGFDA